METTKYQCSKCEEQFTILESNWSGAVTCPRCGLQNISPGEYCSLEVGPPPWEFKCPDCKTRFSVQSPRGPEEVARLMCPVCLSHKVKWQALATTGCATGG